MQLMGNADINLTTLQVDNPTSKSGILMQNSKLLHTTRSAQAGLRVSISGVLLF
jgi:hypothetical protein